MMRPGAAPLHGDYFDLKDRHHCTDIPCCFAFLAALVAGGILYVRGLAEGNIGKLFHGVDGEGRICGVDEAVVDKPLLYWCAVCETQVLPGNACTAPSVDASHPVCVSSCPRSSETDSLTADVPECTSNNLQAYETVTIMDRYCLPDVEDADTAELVDTFNTFSNNISDTYLSDWQTNVMEDLSSIPTAWPVLLGAFFFALALGYLYLLLLRCCAQPLIIITWVATTLGLLVLGGFLWGNAGTLSGGNIPDSMAQHEEDMTKGAAVICWLLGAALICVMCCFFSSLRVATACIEVASEVIWEMPQLLILPVAKAAIKGVAFWALVYGFLMLYTIAPVTTEGSGLYRHFEHTWYEWGELLYFIFISFWIMEFLSALYQFIVAYAVCDWYLQPFIGNPEDNEKDVQCCDVCQGIEVGLFMHAGSIAFGALIIALLRTIQAVLAYAEKKNKEGPDNACVGCLLRIALCCVGCCKEIMEHINRNAYVDIALTSHTFCEAAHNALAMVAHLGGAMGILNGATMVFTIFGTAAITLGTGGLSFLIVSNFSYADETSDDYIDNPTAVLIAACLIGFVVALCFMDVFDMASDALLYCYGNDMVQNTGGHTAPMAMKALFHQTQVERSMS